MALLYAGSIVCWAAAARYFGAWAAIAVAAALLLYQGYAPHVPRALERARVRSGVRPLGAAPDEGGVRAVGSPVRARRPRHRAARARPAGERRPDRVRRVPVRDRREWRDRLRWAGAVALAAALPLAAWSVHNGVRFDTWSLARGGNAIIPFYRAFITDNIVSPENGESSRRLAAAMQQHLLTREPYRSYGVTLDQLFEKGSFRVHEDLYLLSDEVFGWDSDYAILREGGCRGRARPPGRVRARRCPDDLGRALEGAVPGRVGAERARADRKRAAGNRRSSTESGFPRRAKGSRSPQVRSCGSRGRTTAFDRSGRRRPNGTSSSLAPPSAPASSASSVGRRSSSTPSPTAPGTRSSHSASTSCRVGSRVRGCGSSWV